MEQQKKKWTPSWKGLYKIKTPEGFIEDYPNMSGRELIEKYGISKSNLKLFQMRHNLHKSAEHLQTAYRVKKKPRLLSEEELKRFLALAPTHTSYELAEIFHITTPQAGSLRRFYGMPASPEIKAKAYADMGRRRKERKKRRVLLGLEKDYWSESPKRQNTRRLLYRGYIIDEEASIAYWDEKTKRSTRAEKLQRHYTFQEWTPEIAKQYEN